LSGDWVIDVADQIRNEQFDWDRLIDAIERLGLALPTLAGLGYLRERMRLPVPSHVVHDLERSARGVAPRLLFWASRREGETRNLFEKAANVFATWRLRRRGYRVVEKDTASLIVRRPSPLWNLVPAADRARPDTQWANEHQLSVPGDAARPRLVIIEFVIRRPPVSRRVWFDISADGVALARIRTRAGGRAAGGERRFLAAVPLKAHAPRSNRIAISARPIRFLRPDVTADERTAAEPVPFRVTRLRVARLPRLFSAAAFRGKGIDYARMTAAE
jgi:hypothetical protein